MRKLIVLLVAVPLLFTACKKDEPEIKKDLLIGTVWENKGFLSKYLLEFHETNKAKYSIIHIDDGKEVPFGEPTILEFNIASGTPLVDAQSTIIIGNTYSWQGDKITIYKDFLVWESTSVIDGKPTKDTFQKIK
ncbi:MAG: hypothetical protein GX102_13755 [Porphyromonadaceae bacterium]|nr:hypothetical protein [Porphyromonadaceae bacterium]